MSSKKDYNARRRERYANDKEYRIKELERSKKYQRVNEEKVSARRKKYYSEHTEECKARTKKWMSRNREYWVDYVMSRNKKKKEENDQHNSPSI